jgi:hypothetical protein
MVDKETDECFLTSINLLDQSLIQKVRPHHHLVYIDVWIKFTSLQGHQNRSPHDHHRYYRHHYHHLLHHHRRLHFRLHSRYLLHLCPHHFHPHCHYRKNLHHFRPHHLNCLPCLLDILVEMGLLRKDQAAEAAVMDILLPRGINILKFDSFDHYYPYTGKYGDLLLVFENSNDYSI